VYGGFLPVLVYLCVGLALCYTAGALWNAYGWLGLIVIGLPFAAAAIAMLGAGPYAAPLALGVLAVAFVLSAPALASAVLYVAIPCGVAAVMARMAALGRGA